MIETAHRFVLGRISEALGPLVPNVSLCGTSDLAIGALKFSGNSVRVKQRHLLYHGTLLYDFPLELIEKCLHQPPREPDYRRGRPHGEFVTNLPVGRHPLREAVIGAFGAGDSEAAWPKESTARLVAERYGRNEWNRQR